MISYNALKWCVGVTLSLGLTACNWNAQRPNYVDTHYESINQPKHMAQHHSKPVQKTYASKDPTQKSTPGPVHKTAPQLPVIQ